MSYHLYVHPWHTYDINIMDVKWIMKFDVKILQMKVAQCWQFFKCHVFNSIGLNELVKQY
jgi:hypothetical protein